MLRIYGVVNLLAFVKHYVAEMAVSKGIGVEINHSVAVLVCKCRKLLQGSPLILLKRDLQPAAMRLVRGSDVCVVRMHDRSLKSRLMWGVLTNKTATPRFDRKAKH